MKTPRATSVLLGWVALGLGLGTAACSSGRVCDPGATQRCVCPVGEGAQTCDSSGSGWGACRCDGADGGLLDGGSSDAGVDAASACTTGATTATIADVDHGTVAAGTRVRLDGVVAMSPVFAFRKTAADECIWGAFVSAPGLTQTAAWSGLLVTGYGAMATIPPGETATACPNLGRTPTGSAFPDDLAPGDVLSVIGTIEYAASPTCALVTGGSSVPQRTLAQTCSVEVTGHAAPPAPVVISPADAARMASTSDVVFHDQWAGVLVRVADVSASIPAEPASTCTTGTSVVDRYGGLRLDGSGLLVSDHLYYQGILGIDDPCHTGPRYCTTGAGQDWSFIEGFHYLDSCVWGLAPDDKCGGLSPASADCTVASCL